MAAVTVKAKMTTEDLLAAIEQLAPRQAETVTRRLLHLQARRRTTRLSKRESELLNEIFREKRAGFQERFDELRAKCISFTLDAEEEHEFHKLVEESEAFTLRRVEALGELSQLRQLTLPALMKQLGLKAQAVA